MVLNNLLVLGIMHVISLSSLWDLLTRADTSLFIYNKSGLTTYLLVYVDDLILTRNNDGFLMDIISQLASKFSIKDLGKLSFFLGVEVIPTTSGLFLSQHMYIRDLLERAKMQDAKSVHSPMSTSQTPKLHDGVALTDPIEYRSILAAYNARLLLGLT